MATVKLCRRYEYRDEVKPDRLPPVCMRCGASADLQKYKNFSWHPGWVNILILVVLLPGIIAWLVLTKRMAVKVPLCNRHKNHWLVRTLVVLGGLAFIGACAIATIVLLSSADRRQAGQDGDQLGGYACVGTLGALLLLIVVAVIAQSTSIRPTEITERSITLAGVAREFKDALLNQEAAYSDGPDRRA